MTFLFFLALFGIVGCVQKSEPPTGIREDLYMRIVDYIKEIEKLHKSTELTDRDLLKMYDFQDIINITSEELGLFGEMTLLLHEFVDYKSAKDKKNEIDADRHLREFEKRLQKIKNYLKI